MTTEPTTESPNRPPPELAGQTVVVIGGSAGIGLATARLARGQGAEVVLAARNPERLEQAGREIGARSTVAFDALDAAALERFFAELPKPVDHLLVTAGGPYYAPLPDFDFAKARRSLDEHLFLPIEIARLATDTVRPGGTLLFLGFAGGGSRSLGGFVAASGAALPALVAGLAVELAPIRVNLIAAGFVDTPLSARLLGDDLEARREELRATLPIGRVVGPDDIAALAVHLMTNTAVTGAAYDIDGGQHLVS